MIAVNLEKHELDAIKAALIAVGEIDKGNGVALASWWPALVAKIGSAAQDAGTSNFWVAYERITNNAKATEVGKLMVAAGYDTAHTGGGCMCWEKVLANKCYLWICDEGNGLGDTVSEPYLVGLYDMQGEPLDSDLMPNLKMALEWCESRIECSGEMAEAAMCRELKEWCEREGLPYMSADEIEPVAPNAPKQREWLASYISRWEAMISANLDMAAIARRAQTERL